MAKRDEPRAGRPFRRVVSNRLGFNFAYDLSSLAWAYREAANLLYRETEDSFTSISTQPVIYLFRHAMECAIKGILNTHCDALGLTEDEIRKRQHDLCKQVPDLIRAGGLAGFKLEERTIDTINSLGSSDARGTAYRYEAPKGTYDLDHFVTEVEAALDDLDQLERAVGAVMYRDATTEA